MGKNSTHGGISMMQIFFLVLLLEMFAMLWVITKQGQIIMELHHKINMMFSRKKHKPSLQLKEEIT